MQLDLRASYNCSRLLTLTLQLRRGISPEFATPFSRPATILGMTIFVLDHESELICNICSLSL